MITAAVVLADKQRLIPAYRIVITTGEELQSWIIDETASADSPVKWIVSRIVPANGEVKHLLITVINVWVA